jgi:cytochrome c-L
MVHSFRNMNVAKKIAIHAGLTIGMVSAVLGAAPPTALDLRNTITGEPLNLEDALPEGRDTPGVKKFLQTGHDPYIEDLSCLRQGQQLFLTACSGCHGLDAEGKIGPGLNDDYWTYPKNETDQGIFETVFGGARAQMGPHNEDLTLDQMLQVIAWVRHLYKDPVEHAPWLTPEQKKAYKPYTEANGKMIAALADETPGQCAASAK